MKRRISLILSAVILGFMVSSNSYADEKVNLEEINNNIPIQKILKDISNKYKGNFTEIKLEKKKKEVIYEIELLDNKGIKWKFKYNAKNGLLINSNNSSNLKPVKNFFELEKLINIVSKRGELVEAELDKKNGKYIYEIEIINKKGVINKLKFDALTGKELLK